MVSYLGKMTKSVRQNDGGIFQMADYEKMYSTLFNAITDALESMKQQNLGTAKDILIRAQQETEKQYMSEK